MLICISCQHPNMDGAVFCDQCVELLDVSASTDSPLVQNRTAAADLPLLLEDGNRSIFPNSREDCWIAVRILDTNETIALTFGDEFTVGRFSDDGQAVPDFDLTRFGALELGVSRVHAVIGHGVAGVRIKDLWSSNGTYLHGSRLQANVHETLHHGDVVSFAKLRVEILLHTSPVERLQSK